MTFTSGGCRDLRQYMNDPKTMAVFGKLISGRAGYMPIEEKRQEIPICSGCGLRLTGDEKFCPECGTKIEKKQKQEQ